MLIGLFGRKSHSREVAKDRLRYVLMQDRLSLAPQAMEKMKDAVVVAISKYIEVDPRGIEFSWKDVEQKRALVASIPVKSVKRGVAQDDRASQRPC